MRRGPQRDCLRAEAAKPKLELSRHRARIRDHRRDGSSPAILDIRSSIPVFEFELKCEPAEKSAMTAVVNEESGGSTTVATPGAGIPRVSSWYHSRGKRLFDVWLSVFPFCRVCRSWRLSP